MITFKNVSYSIKNKRILDNITFNIKDNEKVLLYGPSGSGKSSIVNLLLKNINPTSGAIYYDKENINEYTKEELCNYKHNRVILILQKDDLFDYLSVLDNLTLFYYEEESLALLKKAGLLHLSNRYVYSLSGGERQRIAIIKACLANCDTLVCDEITSALDKDNAIKIIQFVLSINKDKTIIFIAHDLSIFDGIVDHKIGVLNHKINKDEIINEVNNKKSIGDTKKYKPLYKISIINGFKKYKITGLIIAITSIICFLVSFNFNDIFHYLAKQSYEKYFNYDVLFIMDNDAFNINPEIGVYPSYQTIFENSDIYINNSKKERIAFLPFNNKDNNSRLVINSSLAESQSIDEVKSIKIYNDFFSESFNNIDIIEESNMFTTPCIYYDVIYFYNKYQLTSESLVIIKDDLSIIDEGFTNNPLFNNKEEELPYLDSKAYNDYLIFEMVFESLKSMVNYYFVIVVIYSILISVLLNVSYLLRDIKQIAIYLSRGHRDIEIQLTYLIPVFINHLLLSLICMIRFSFIYSVLLSFAINVLSIILSYCYIKSKPLHELLKEENLC